MGISYPDQNSTPFQGKGIIKKGNRLLSTDSMPGTRLRLHFYALFMIIASEALYDPAPAYPLDYISSQAPTSLPMLWPCWPLPFQSMSSSSYLRTFALAVPSANNALLLIFVWLTPCQPSFPNSVSSQRGPPQLRCPPSMPSHSLSCSLIAFSPQSIIIFN